MADQGVDGLTRHAPAGQHHDQVAEPAERERLDRRSALGPLAAGQLDSSEP